jgi:hypothetical protein
MGERVERRKVWSRIVGVERRAAPLPELDGHPLPDPTLLADEEFLAVARRVEEAKRKAAERMERWYDPTRFD